MKRSEAHDFLISRGYDEEGVSEFVEKVFGDSRSILAEDVLDAAWKFFTDPVGAKPDYLFLVVNDFRVTFACLGENKFYIHGIKKPPDRNTQIVDCDVVSSRVGVEIDGDSFANVISALFSEDATE